MHLLPSTIKKEKTEDVDAEDSSSYKKQKEARDKANSARYRGSCSEARQHNLPNAQEAGMHVGSLQGLYRLPKSIKCFPVQLCFLYLLPT